MKSLFEANREKIMTAFVAVAGIFLLFYWTHSGFESARLETKAAVEQLESKVEKARALTAKVAQQSKQANPLKTGLLSFVQTQVGSLNLSDKLQTVKPLISSNTSETVSVRLENMTIDEIGLFLTTVEKFDNLAVKSFTLAKRFDNPQRADISLEILKGK